MHPDLIINIKNQENYADHAIISMIIDHNCKFQAISKYMLGDVGINEIIGKSFIELDNAIISKLTGLTNGDSIEQVKASYQKFNRLIEATINEKRIISCLDITQYHKDTDPYINTFIPIFSNDKGSIVVGVKMVSSIFRLFGVYDYFKVLHVKPSNLNNLYSTLNLATRQHEILYLLANGFSQIEAAQILNISRGALANIVSEQICPKFNINGSNMKVLIEKAKLMKLDKYMPKSLLKSSVIVFDQDIVDKYFSD